MKIIEVTENKKEYLDLLLLADEQEDMIDRYLERGRMYVLDDDGVKCECVVTDEGDGILEIKNIATVPADQKKGYAKALIDFLVRKFSGQYHILQVGTGDSPLSIPFYKKCGFVRSHNIPNFFVDNYDHPIFEGGVQLVDTEKKCPLCGVSVFHPELERPEGKPLYPPERYPAPQVSSRAALIVLSTLFLMPVFITLICDLQISGGITWSGYVAGALMLAYIMLVLPTWFRKPNPVILVPCNFVAIGLFLQYINWTVDEDWFLSFALPVTAFVALVATTVTVLLRYIRRGRLYIFGGAFLALGAFMPLMELLLCLSIAEMGFVGWSLYPLIPLVLLGGTLIFLAISAPAREKMERKLFI